MEKQYMMEMTKDLEVLRQRTLTWMPNSVNVAPSQGEIVLNYGKEELKLTPASLINLGQLAGIPGPYLSKCPVHLIIPHINYWGNELVEEFKVLVDDKDVVQAAMKVKSEFVPPSSIIAEIESAFDDDEELDYDKPAFNLDFCHLAITSSTRVYGEEDKKMQGGVSIAFSPTGKSNYQLSAYLLKEICTNGLVAPVSLFKWTKKWDPDICDWIASASAQAVECIKEEAERLLDTENYEVEGHLGDVLSSVFTMYYIPTDIREMIEDRVLNLGANTVYDIIDAITYVTSNTPEILEDTKLMYRLLKVAGTIAANPEVCPECHRCYKG